MAITTLIIDHYNQIVEPQNNYLIRLLADRWDFVPYKHGLPEKGKKQPPPDLIVFYHTIHVDNCYRLDNINKKWGYIPFLLCVTGEWKNITAGMADWSISYTPQSSNNYYLPVFAEDPLFTTMIYENQKNQEQHKDVNKDALPCLKNLPPQLFATMIYENQKNQEQHKDVNKDTLTLSKNISPQSEYLPEHLLEYSQILKEFRNTDKSHFCNFIYSHLDKDFSGTVTRRDFCKSLMKYKKVDCAGRIMQNTDELKRLEENIIHDKRSSINPFAKHVYISKYKFTIAFENTSYPHYFTEKILDPFLVGSIPIYWGCPQVAQMFNPAAFINCHDYSSLDKVVARVQEIDNDHELYLKYATAPPLLPDSLIYNFTPDKVQTELYQIMQKVVKHKELSRNNSSYSLLQKVTKPQLLHHYIQCNRRRIRLKIKLGVLKIKGIVKHILIALRVPEWLWRR